MQGLVCFINTLSIYFVFLEVTRAMPSSLPPTPPSYAISKIYVLTVLLEYIDLDTYLYYSILLYSYFILSLGIVASKVYLLEFAPILLAFCSLLLPYRLTPTHHASAMHAHALLCQYTIVQDHVIMIISHSCNTFCHHRI